MAKPALLRKLLRKVGDITMWWVEDGRIPGEKWPPARYVVSAGDNEKTFESSVKNSGGAFSGMATREGPWVELLQADRAPAIGSVSTAMRARKSHSSQRRSRLKL